MLSFLPKLLVTCAGLILLGSPVLRALDGPSSFTLDFPIQVNEVTPAWMGQPIVPATNFATLNVPITPPDAKASLLVTVLFQEKQGGFLRITWQGAQSAQVLSDNFYEGIAMSNQRSLLVPAEVLQGGGSLNFQCGDTTLGVQHIKFEWVESQTSLVSPQVQDLLVTPAVGATQPASNLDGQPKQADPGAWHDTIVNVPITDAPERIEQGVEFSIQIDNLPASGRVVLKEAGLAFGKHLVVWINQHRAGLITPAVPDLQDNGYLASSPIYVGWREGSFSVPVSFLQVGNNAVQFSVEDDVPSATGSTADASTTSPAPLALKNVELQLDYPPAPFQPQTPADNSSAPTGSIPAPGTSPETILP